MVTLPIVEHAAVPFLVFMANVAALSLVACGAALAAARVRRAAPLPLRHAVLLTGLCLTAAGPLLVGAVEIAGRSLVTVATRSPIASDRAKSQAAPQEQSDSSRPSNGNVQMIAAAEAAVASPEIPLTDLATITAPASPASPPRRNGERLLGVGFALLATWIAGSCWQLWRLAMGLMRIRALVSAVEPVHDLRIVEAARRAARAVGLRRLPTLGQSTAIDAPLSVGMLHGQIVLPTAAAGEWSDFELRSLLVHEMAHLRRRDLPVGLLQRVTAAVFWWNPLLSCLNRSLSETREQICDDLVAQHVAETRGYARLLVELAARATAPRFPVAALGAVDGSPSELGRRVRRLLDSRRRIVTALNARTAALVATFAAALLACLLAACVRLAPATAAESEVVAEADAKDDAAPQFEMSKKVRIVDGDGKPIAGAKVEPWAMRARNGHGQWSAKGMGASEPPKLTSDADGFATIPFPKYAQADGEIRPDALTVRVDHPDFVQSVYNDAPVTPQEIANTTTITMEPGAVVEVAGLVDGEPLPISEVYALWASPGSGDTLLTPGGKRRLPRMPAGKELIRLAYLPADGAAMFSSVEEVDLVAGQQLELALDMAPAARVQGRLDASVPRPVTNGVVIAQVIRRHPDNNGRSVNWRSWTTVAEDGTFELPPVPAGELQVIALCDGFMAESGTAPASDGNPGRVLGAHFNGPQVFTVASGVNAIEIPMTPTADCVFHVEDPAGKPIVGARVGFWPNVTWWGGGSQIYAGYLYGTEELLTAEDAERDFDWTKQPFIGLTDAEGNTVIKNIPATESRYIVTHDDWELWTDANRQQSGNVDLQPGKLSEVDLVMQPKGTTPPVPAPEPAGALPVLAPARGGTHIPKPDPPPAAPTAAEETELAGVVVDEQSRPLADVDVDAWTWHPGNETKTDDEGRFRLAGFEPKEAIEVEFTRAGYSPSLYVAQPAGTQNWVIVLTQGTTLVGKVLDPAGEPVAGATVRASRGPFENPQVQISEVWTEATTGDDGGYVLPLEPYVYDVQVRVPGVGVARREQVNVEAKRQTPLDIALEKGVTLRANVRNSVTGEPVEGLVLWSWIQPGIEGTSNAEGVLEISGMMPGDFAFNVSAVGLDRRTSSGAGEYGRWWSPQAIHEHQRADGADRHGFQRNFDDLAFHLLGETAEVEILVEPGVTITGRVIDPDGKPVAGVTVAPAKTGSGNSITGDTRYSYKTDDAGRFTMKMPASKKTPYNLVAHDGTYQEWRTWAAAVGPPLYTEPGEKIEGVELRLARPATIRGRVMTAAGEPRAGAKVRAIGTDGLDNRYYVPTTKTDADGRYELKFVRPGEHRVQVEPFWLDPQAAPNQSTKTITVEEGGEVDGVDLVADKAEWLGP